MRIQENIILAIKRFFIVISQHFPEMYTGLSSVACPVSVNINDVFICSSSYSYSYSSSSSYNYSNGYGYSNVAMIIYTKHGSY